jgi:hypothetical protein
VAIPRGTLGHGSSKVHEEGCPQKYTGNNVVDLIKHVSICITKILSQPAGNGGL